MVSVADLLSLVEQGFSLARDTRSNLLGGLKRTEAQWYVYFDVFYAEFDSMQSVVLLLKSQKYRECLTILRTIFEYYFLLVLMMEGKRYRWTRRYYIKPGPNSTKSESRDRTLDRWRKEWRSGKSGYEDIIAIHPGKREDAIDVTMETEGLYEQGDVDKKGPIVPRFYFVYDQYDPDVHYLSELGSLYVAGTASKGLVEEHRRLYAQFLNIKRIGLNLRLNKLVTQEEMDRFWVHYNFLSSYAHPTRRSVIDPPNILPSWPRQSERDEAFELLVLGYLAQFQSMYLRLLLNYFEKRNRKSTLIAYKSYVRQLESASSYFWFIHNDPSPFDIEESDRQKQWLTHQKLPVPPGLLYYPDPLERIRTMRAIGALGVKKQVAES